ncbi:TonB-dependent receptor [Biformimicrobium ophioploci]|uniref:TonB-dependent receptor n=1 Tax=Biformimicrobium ophioploci TaxID=3036711 RepID=A0ABQ6M0Q9_9GAMM|nr:TonB-dependent receptor [Microbulbifer sp. NKW57]GMG87906.1 TonB-dependent receptor [Microbulbifer sp. NKW57]
MFNKKKLSESVRGHRRVSSLGISASVLAGALLSASAMAQQAGSIEGRVTMDDPAEASGVTVTAKSKVMPRARTVKTDADGEFKLPLLIPGTYTLTFTAEDGTERTVNAEVLLDQSTMVVLDLDAELSANELEEVMVYGEVVSAAGEASLSNAMGADVVKGVPIGLEYRDLMKLLPGVQFTQDSVRGPSAGGSGQDNTYAFDGVDITLPMFGTLSAEPSNHDLEQVAVERGGAVAKGFNRSGGFAVDTKSKSGTNEFQSGATYYFQPKSLVGDTKAGTEYELDKNWAHVYSSGPIIPERLFYYGSYYGPRTHRDNKETAYGPAKDYSVERDEYFGKLTYAPTDDILVNMSYRTSENIGEGASISYNEADSVSIGSETIQEIFTLDGSWVINDSTTFTAEYNTYAHETASLPDVLLGVQPSLANGLDVNNLDQMGYLSVPNLIDGEDAYNAFVAPIILQHGYQGDDGLIYGGGGVGAYSLINDQNFYRESFEMSLDHALEWGDTSHELHAGFRWSEGREELARKSNGWGSVQVIGGLDLAEFNGQDVFYRAYVQQMSLVQADGTTVAPIDSYSESYNLEINDKIEYGDFTFNVGFLISQDILYGQGLREVGGNYSGFENAPGHKYEMYKVDWKDMIQPRLGVTWAYNGEDTVFANFASYNPEASSLARAASWDRNTRATLEVWFDENGNVIQSEPKEGSSGKVFQDDLDPRRTDELTVGTTKGFDNGWSIRSHVRYREGSNFWEDTWNYSRLYGCYGVDANNDGEGDQCVPADIAAKGAYVDDLEDIRAEIGGSSYVIAQLDDAYTKYWEFSLEAKWEGERSYLSASYVRSRYTGNFDQDNTSGYNDANLFIGSSNLADGKGRQLWDNKDGVLRGDRPHIFKTYGYYTTDWNANVGAFFVYQSGQPWEAWDGSIYGYSSDTIRYAEAAGSRRSPSHWQLDLNYTQDFKVLSDYTLQFRADLFNVFDRQTGYNYDPYVDSPLFGTPRSRYNSRRVQLSFGLHF